MSRMMSANGSYHRTYISPIAEEYFQYYEFHTNTLSPLLVIFKLTKESCTFLLVDVKLFVTPLEG